MSERQIDRKAKPESSANVDAGDLPDDGGSVAERGFGKASDSLKRIAASLPAVPSVSAYGFVVAVLYASVVFGALSVAYGTTSLVVGYAGVHAGMVAGGSFAFAYGYVALVAATRDR